VLAFAVKLGSARFLHLGDAWTTQNETALAAYPFAAKKIDVAFVLLEEVTPEAQKLIRERIDPAMVVGMHVPAADVERVRGAFASAYPKSMVFGSPMETTALP
jgi:hypothetical protein